MCRRFQLLIPQKVKVYIENIEEQNNRMEIVMKNQKLLLEEVMKLLVSRNFKEN